MFAPWPHTPNHGAPPMHPTKKHQIRLLFLFLLAAAGCAYEAPRAPFVQFTGETQIATLSTWMPLGYAIGDTGTECALDWYAPGGDRDCTITIDVQIEDVWSETGAPALASPPDSFERWIVIDRSITLSGGHPPFVAHELGHVLLATVEHTDAGVMSASPQTVNLADDDRALACETVGLGC